MITSSIAILHIDMITPLTMEYGGVYIPTPFPPPPPPPESLNVRGHFLPVGYCKQKVLYKMNV